jgi:hypothetical protein
MLLGFWQEAYRPTSLPAQNQHWQVLPEPSAGMGHLYPIHQQPLFMNIFKSEPFYNMPNKVGQTLYT